MPDTVIVRKRITVYENHRPDCPVIMINDEAGRHEDFPAPRRAAAPAIPREQNTPPPRTKDTTKMNEDEYTDDREPDMEPHSKAALDIVAAADALFKGDAQRFNELLRRLQDARNYDLDFDDTDPVMPAPADIIRAALIAITKVAYADVSEDDSDEDIATRACDLLTSVELDLVDRSPDEPMEWGSREEWLLKLWSCGGPDPSTRNELQWGTLQELEQFMENHPGQPIISTFDITQPGGRYYGFKLNQTPQVSENNGPDITELEAGGQRDAEAIHELGEFQNANPYRLIEVDHDFGYRVVQPGEARPGTVEVVFLPDNPPGQQYRLRPVPPIRARLPMSRPKSSRGRSRFAMSSWPKT
jgi:hypothetical protein